MFEIDRKSGTPALDAAGHTRAKTSHTLNPVPFVLISGEVDPSYQLRRDLEAPGLSNIAATVLNLLGFEAPEDYDPSLIEPA